MLYWLLKSVVLGPLMQALFRPEVEGLEHVPAEGPAILASNHLSFSDSFFLPLVVPRRITFLAKSDYFDSPGLKGRLTATFFRGVGQVPVDRSGGSASEGALSAGLRVLNRGDLLGIYPEGTRSPDGRLYRGKTGVARMALEARCVVVPVAMVGTDKVQPTGQKIPQLGRVGIVIGEPLDFSRYVGQADDRRVLRTITDEIMYELRRLSQQEYVDVYAATVKEQLAEAVRERIGQARTRAQAAATTAGVRAAEARQRVEEARVKMDHTLGEARAKLDAGVEDARAKLDAGVDEARAKVGTTMDEARTKVGNTMEEAKARVENTVEEARAKVEQARHRSTGDTDPATPEPAAAETRPETAGPQPPTPGEDSQEPARTEEPADAGGVAERSRAERDDRDDDQRAAS